MKTIKVLFAIFGVFLLTNAQAQFFGGETTKWCFGGNGADDAVQLDFSGNTQNPVASVGLNNNYSLYEGGTSFADTNGDLLFYTTGNRVYNAQHIQMPNGGNLIGNQSESSSQGSMVVRQPGSFNRYYLFTTPDLVNSYTTTGFRYHVIDMDLQGGLGDVIAAESNIELFTNCAEKVCAVAHSNGTDVWILTHEDGTTNYRAYLLTAQGLNTTPVISAGVLNITGNAGRGCMKFSPKGRKVCMAATSNVSSAGFNNSAIEIADFNATTGQLSNFVGDQYSTSGFSAYGVEFSPDGSKLYVNDRSGNDKLYQYNVSAGNNTAIKNSKVLIATKNTSSDNGSIQLAPNGCIYIAENSAASLGVINNPNALGLACNYVQSGLAIPERSSLSLPNFCASYFAKYSTTIIRNNLCDGDSVSYKGNIITSDATFLDTILLLNLPYDSLVYRVYTVRPTWHFYDTIHKCKSTAMYQGHALAQSGNYSYHYTSQFGCDSVYNLNYTNVVLDVAAKKAGNHLLAMPIDTINYTYQWIDSNGKEVPGADSYQFYPPDSANYLVVVQSKGCYTSSNYVSVASPLSVTATFLTQPIRLYPQPARGSFVVEGAGSANAYSIFTLGGRQVKHGYLLGQNRIEISVAELPKGMYVLRLADAHNHQRTIKLMVQ